MNCTEANKEFMCSSLLVKALLQFLSAPERKNATEWLQKLHKLSDEMPDAKIRNEYAGCLLINVQNGRLTPPFNRVPPCGKLRPLSRILPEHRYEDAMKQMKVNFCFVKGPDCEEVEVVEEKMKPLIGEPSDFRDEQPCPKKGIIAYCSAFSNYQE